MGAALDMIKEYDLALEYIFNALNIFDSIGEKRIICSSYLNIGEHYELRVNGKLQKNIIWMD